MLAGCCEFLNFVAIARGYSLRLPLQPFHLLWMHVRETILSVETFSFERTELRPLFWCTTRRRGAWTRPQRMFEGQVPRSTTSNAWLQKKKGNNRKKPTVITVGISEVFTRAPTLSYSRGPPAIVAAQNKIPSISDSTHDLGICKPSSTSAGLLNRRKGI